jgi:centromeric protein E
LPAPIAGNASSKNIEEMTRMLDEMIGMKVDKAARRSSLMPVSEG